MSDPRSLIEAKLHAFWEQVLEATLADCHADKIDSETLSMLPDAMVHVGLARMAEREGAARTARQLRMIADKFSQAGRLEGGLRH